MKREYLEDYRQREEAEFAKIERRIMEGKFSFEKDRYPPDERFIKLKYPVALPSPEGLNINKIWAQLPFSGSLIFQLMPNSRIHFEKSYLEVSEIPRMIDFIKETGKIQVVLPTNPLHYEGLDFLDPFFQELKPPLLRGIPVSFFGSMREIRCANEAFNTLGKSRYFGFIRQQLGIEHSESMYKAIIDKDRWIYILLKLGHYAVAKEIENLMIDDPRNAEALIIASKFFIIQPTCSLRSTTINFTANEIHYSQLLPHVYQPREVRFPCEIGSFLLEKLTYAPLGLDACKELMYHYDKYDLQKIQESLNEAIVTNHPDIVNENSKALSEIMDNVWNDKTIPRRVKCVQTGVPLSMAAIGSVAAGPIGAAGGFLAGLGYSVADKLIDFQTEGLSEKLAKVKTKSYQANIYDFKEKYKHNIPKPSKEKG